MIIGPISDYAYRRGFLLTQSDPETLQKNLEGMPYAHNVTSWAHTFFGPCTLWHDPLLNYAVARDNKYGVGLLGLCLNPFDGLGNNNDIAEALYQALKAGRDAFFDYVDQLSGSFVIIYRENADVRVLQDTAATKTIYYHKNTKDQVTVASHARIVAHLHNLPNNPDAKATFADKNYQKDPSRYLPGLVTHFSELLPLTANSELIVSSARSNRFFPRKALPQREFGSKVVNEIVDIMIRQAEILGSMGRKLRLAATGGRDSRVSAATFSGQPRLSYFSFYMPTANHLIEDVEVAQSLSEAEGIELNIYDLEAYKHPDFNKVFQAVSPGGIWPGAALCYLEEFDTDDIHIRSTVSEIGRIFYNSRSAKKVTAEALAQSYTQTEFNKTDFVLDAMADYIKWTKFDTDRFFNYSLYDMFYWEHRNSKWQNVLCSEAEMATDVFIPFNNRNLLKLFMSVPFEYRQQAKIHLAICDKLKPEFKGIKFA